MSEERLQSLCENLTIKEDVLQDWGLKFLTTESNNKQLERNIELMQLEIIKVREEIDELVRELYG